MLLSDMKNQDSQLIIYDQNGLSIFCSENYPKMEIFTQFKTGVFSHTQSPRSSHRFKELRKKDQCYTHSLNSETVLFIDSDNPMNFQAKKRRKKRRPTWQD